MHRLEVLKEEYSNCQKCPSLCESRTQVVFGIGNPSAQILIVAEAPGVEEDKTGLPLIGQSGKILDWYLCQYLGLPNLIHDFSLRGGFKKAYMWPSHEEAKYELCKKVFYTNSVLCRPKDNRDPSHDELVNCRNRLYEVIYQVDPKLILSVGKIALESLTGKKVSSILKKRGTLTEITIPGKITDIKYPVFSLLHPAYLMRNPFSNDSTNVWQLTHMDVKNAIDLVNEYNK